MKRILTTILSIISLQALAQWSDTTNFFEDTLHMPVVEAAGVQRHPIVLNSYPDGGFFVVWEDERNMATNNTDIYAQKYDRNGNRLWAENGIPVANNTTREHYTFSSNQDYRNRSVMATDSAGGFYITFSEDSVSSYTWEKVTVQHVRSNGTKVFPGDGYVFARSGTANLNMMPQIIPDGNKGFYLAYRSISTNDYIYGYNYKDEGGSMKYYGGGRMNENAVQTSDVGACGIRTYVLYPGTSITEYNIWPDGEGGCNFIMNINRNFGVQHVFLGYNRLWRCKKDSKVRTYFRNTSGTACPKYTDYKKGDAYLLYTLKTDYQSIACGGGGGPLYTYTNYRLLSNGFLEIDNQGYDYNYPKGVTVTTNGNINVDVMATCRRTYDGVTVSDFIIYGYAQAAQKFDSVPYQRATFSNPEIGYNPVPPPTMSKLNFFRDTLLAFSNYYQDFSVAGGNNNFYATGVMAKTGSRKVLLQHLAVSQEAVDSFAIEYDTDLSGRPFKYGRAIGAEINQGPEAVMLFDLPFVKIARNGKAVFYITESGRGTRISPITSGSQLDWGAMGRLTGTGVYNGSYYNMGYPVLVIDTTSRHGLLAWQDARYIPGTQDNIFMRQINNLSTNFYTPPVKPVKPVYSGSADVVANPAVLYGTSRQYTPIELYNAANSVGFTPVVDIYDVHYLGQVKVHVYNHNGAIRRFNNIPYLSRNITIKTDSLPPGASPDILLYFTTAEFNALKAADISITDPADLVVIRQPGTNTIAPSTYSPVAGEEILSPVTWSAVAGGFRIKIIAKGMGNFFIQKMPTATLCPGTNTSFTSAVTGSTYQWQVNTGSNFVNISNNANYSGATTATLQITNAPASFSGYRYRCVVNSTNVSNSFYLQVANTWTGAVNNLWETAGNWSCNIVPNINIDVIINSGTVTVNSAAACRTLKVSPGVNLSVTPGFNLTVAH